MPDFVMPVDFHVNTRGGDLDIPAGATVHLRDGDNHFLGYTPAEVVFEEPAAPEPAPEPAPAPEPEPPVEETADSAAEEGATDGETEPSQPEQTPGE